MAFDLQGHRGARGLAPENTLAAFARALEIGVTTLETDLAVTKDGVIVLSHDPVLNPDIVRGPDGQWLAAPGPAINSLTLAELKRYDVGRIKPATKYAQQFAGQTPVDGQRIPTLAELFDLAKSSARCRGSISRPSCRRRSPMRRRIPKHSRAWWWRPCAAPDWRGASPSSPSIGAR
jgi:glycerophosphoryl diester phosphodiesterase